MSRIIRITTTTALFALAVIPTTARGNPADPTAPPPMTATESMAGEPAAAEVDEGFWRFVGGAPLGTYLYATQVAEFAFLGGRIGGIDATATGFRYAERGGYVAGAILGLIGIQGQKDAAAAQGKTSVEVHANPLAFAKLNFFLDYYTRGLGGDVDGKIGGISYTLVFGNHQLPMLLDLGLELGSFEAYTSMEQSPERHSRWGVTLAAMVPLTRLAQLEARARAGSPAVSGDVGVTLNLGNLLFGRVSASYADGMGMLVTAGGRI